MTPFSLFRCFAYPLSPILRPIKSYLAAILFLLTTSNSIAQCTAVINSYPYLEGFETGTANWITGGTNNDWTWGSPVKAVINAAGAGSKCWIVGGLSASLYSSAERSWVESPCFDLSSINRPYVSFLIFWDTERVFDGGNLQYTTDGGLNWKNAGSNNDPTTCNNQNWFNINSITNLNGFINNTQGWSGTNQPGSAGCVVGNGSGSWKLATHCLKVLANKPLVKFRFTFGSGTTCNDYDGIAFDNFDVNEAPNLPDNYHKN